MNARNYRVNLSLSPLDFPPVMGLGQSSVSYRSEVPYIINNMVKLTITTKYVLTDISENKEYEVLTVQSVYEIPTIEIKSREDVYEFYKDGILMLNETFKYVKTQMPALPNISFPNQPIESYKQEIDGIFYILQSQN